jgi:hypothetical protein
MLGGPLQRVLGLGALGHGQVEQPDPRPRLADVNPDDVAVLWVHPEHRPRPPADGLRQPGLDDDALVDQLADHVRHRGGAESGRRAQLVPASCLAQVERPQDRGPVLASQVTDRAALTVLHPAPRFEV